MKAILFSFTLFALVSCAGSKQAVYRKAPPSDMKLTFENFSMRKDSTSSGTTLTGIFGVLESSVEKVTVYFDSSDQIRIDYEDKFGRRSNYGYAGKFRKRSYDYYKSNSHKGIPPFYWITDVERLRFKLEADSTLVVQYYYNRSGMILLMAGGGSDKREYRFKRVSN